MNLVLDETIEEVSPSEKHVIGMVVSYMDCEQNPVGLYFFTSNKNFEQFLIQV